jgi:hypothetical protein
MALSLLLMLCRLPLPAPYLQRFAHLLEPRRAPAGPSLKRLLHPGPYAWSLTVCSWHSGVPVPHTCSLTACSQHTGVPVPHASSHGSRVSWGGDEWPGQGGGCGECVSVQWHSASKQPGKERRRPCRLGLFVREEYRVVARGLPPRHIVPSK